MGQKLLLKVFFSVMCEFSPLKISAVPVTINLALVTYTLQPGFAARHQSVVTYNIPPVTRRLLHNACDIVTRSVC